jgi:3'(2'), 5'-bisphosphate nucleotidase
VGGLAVLRSRLGAENPALLAALPDAPVASLTVVESALKFCHIAEGSADAYVRLGRTMEWDTAAGEAILSAAGGSLLVLDGGALGYGKPGWVNPPFICRGGL